MDIYRCLIPDYDESLRSFQVSRTKRQVNAFIIYMFHTVKPLLMSSCSPPSAGFCFGGRPQGTHSAFGGWSHPASADKVSDMVNIGNVMKKYWKSKIKRKVFLKPMRKKMCCFAACLKALSNRWFFLRPLTDHIEVLTDHIEILKYSNRQKVICTLYCKIETKFLFL